jgi:YggT family protein
MLLFRIIDLYSLIVLAAVVLSWIRVDPHNPLVRIVHISIEPALDPIRRVLPPMGGFDFSPMVLLIGLQLLKGLVL